LFHGVRDSGVKAAVLNSDGGVVTDTYPSRSLGQILGPNPEGMSTREIGDVLGVGNKTVARDQLAVSGDTSEYPESSLTCPGDFSRTTQMLNCGILPLNCESPSPSHGLPVGRRLG
jgi:hypothetical protein